MWTRRAGARSSRTWTASPAPAARSSARSAAASHGSSKLPWPTGSRASRVRTASSAPTARNAFSSRARTCGRSRPASLAAQLARDRAASARAGRVQGLKQHGDLLRLLGDGVAGGLPGHQGADRVAGPAARNAVSNEATVGRCSRLTSATTRAARMPAASAAPAPCSAPSSSTASQRSSMLTWRARSRASRARIASPAPAARSSSSSRARSQGSSRRTRPAAHRAAGAVSSGFTSRRWASSRAAARRSRPGRGGPQGGRVAVEAAVPRRLSDTDQIGGTCFAGPGGQGVPERGRGQPVQTGAAAVLVEVAGDTVADDLVADDLVAGLGGAGGGRDRFEGAGRAVGRSAGPGQSPVGGDDSRRRPADAVRPARGSRSAAEGRWRHCAGSRRRRPAGARRAVGPCGRAGTRPSPRR